MASKKYTLVAAMLVLFQVAGMAQSKTDWGWDWKDSSKVPTKKLPQYNEFLNNQYPYPPMPRNAWELGVSVGNAFILGDRPVFVKNPATGGNYTGGLVVGLSLRKALGHVVSVRGTLNYSMTSIPSYKTMVATKNTTWMGSLSGIFSLNTASHYRGNPKFNLYLVGGYSLIATEYKTRATNGSYNLSYYNKSQTAGKLGDLTLIHGVNYGAGMAFKVSPKFNIGLEQVFTAPIFGNDYLDGYKSPFGAGDMFSYSTIRFNFNIGN